MKLCIVRIDVADDAPDPVAKPDEGEIIEKHLVPLRGLTNSLSGWCLIHAHHIQRVAADAFSLHRLPKEGIRRRC